MSDAQKVHDFWNELGFCWCGSPGDVLTLIRDSLKAKTADDWWKHGDTSPAGYLLEYTMDRVGLTEHGGSVPGWLTDKGREILALLESVDIETVMDVE